MESPIRKTSEQVRGQMEFWFLHYHRKTLEQVDGLEQFTIFSKISEERQAKWLQKIHLFSEELPVLLLQIDNNNAIINTTHKFICLTENNLDFINYVDFEWHAGYKSIIIKEQESINRMSVKTDGYVSEFGLRKRNAEIIYWKIPTGKSGFAFWNVTKKCELIGRKYLIVENE